MESNVIAPGGGAGGPDADAVRAALREVAYPGLTRDLVSFGLVRDVTACGGSVKVRLAIRSPSQTVVAALERAIGDKLTRLGARSVTLEIIDPEPATAAPRGIKADPWSEQVKLATVRHVIAVGAGKGGVGKSTVAVNLALALARDGLRVGILDADIYGPSLPILLSVEDGAARARMTADKHIVPIEAHGLPLVSFGFFLGEESPAIWRGPMVSKAVRQFARGVAWGELDLLVVDLPPGTGDVPLSLAQSIELSGAVVVTQPARVAAAEARKAVAMFTTLGVRVLGVLENMTGAFGAGTGRDVSADAKVPFLGSIPFDADVVGECDAGRPSMIARPASEVARAFSRAAEQVAGALGWRHADPAA